jgi:anti-sigma B factor antagonist
VQDGLTLTPGGLRVTTIREGASLVLVLTGELDLASVPMLERRLDASADAGVVRVVVDLRGLEFLDSSGLQLLLRAQAQLRGRRHELLLRPGARAVQQVFELTSTAGLFRFEE